MLANLLADPSDFRLYCWDNASEDGAADLIAKLDDPRVASSPRAAMSRYVLRFASKLHAAVDDHSSGRLGRQTRTTSLSGTRTWLIWPKVSVTQHSWSTQVLPPMPMALSVTKTPEPPAAGSTDST